jgi:hypothetical protein
MDIWKGLDRLTLNQKACNNLVPKGRNSNTNNRTNVIIHWVCISQQDAKDHQTRNYTTES